MVVNLIKAKQMFSLTLPDKIKGQYWLSDFDDVGAYRNLISIEAVDGKRLENKDDLIFYDYNKKSMISTSQVNNYYRRICEKANIPNGGQHALRHTFATRCIESGIPAVVLKNWLGHTNIHITLDIYTDVFNSMNNKAVGEFDKYLESM